MSIFNDKSLKSVAEAAAKIMEAEKMATKDHDKDGKIETGKEEYLGSRIRAARLAGKLKEEEQLDELSKSTVKSYVMKKIEKPTTTKKDVKGLTNAYNRLKNYKPTSEAVELGEEKGEVHVRNKKSGKELMIPAIAVATYEKHGYYPVPGSVKEGFDDMDKYMKDKNKESSFEKKKTDKGTAYSRKPAKPETEKKVEEGFDDMDKYMKDKNKPQPSGSAGKKPGKAYGGSKQPEEKKSMTEMLELYNEHGLKVLSMVGTKSVKFGDTEVEVIDADDVNGFVETVVEERTQQDSKKPAVVKTNKPIGYRTADIGPGGKEYNVKTDKAWDDHQKKMKEEVDNETFTKEVNAQKAKAEGKGKKAEVAKASVQAVKQEGVEQIDELKKSTIGSYIQKKFAKMSDEPVSKNQYGYAKKDAKGIQRAGLRMSGIKATQKEEVELGEARKLEGSYKNEAGHESKVYKLSGEHNEGDPYHVKLFKGGKHHEPADYFTDDKDDAHSTAKRMVKESLEERHLTAAETKKKEETVKSMKKGLSGFKARYGDRAKEVMYATATKQAKKD
jgi:hypothetical protein